MLKSVCKNKIFLAVKQKLPCHVANIIDYIFNHMIHEIIAAIGGLLFIVFGIARQRERRRLITAGIKTEGPFCGTYLSFRVYAWSYLPLG